MSRRPRLLVPEAFESAGRPLVVPAPGAARRLAADPGPSAPPSVLGNTGHPWKHTALRQLLVGEILRDGTGARPSAAPRPRVAGLDHQRPLAHVLPHQLSASTRRGPAYARADASAASRGRRRSRIASTWSGASAARPAWVSLTAWAERRKDIALAPGTPVVDSSAPAFTDAGRPVEVDEMTLDAGAYIPRHDFDA
jgi:hypothetical protein